MRKWEAACLSGQLHAVHHRQSMLKQISSHCYIPRTFVSWCHDSRVTLVRRASKNDGIGAIRRILGDRQLSMIGFNGTMTDASILPAFGLMIVMASLFIFWASRLFRTATS